MLLESVVKVELSVWYEVVSILNVPLLPLVLMKPLPVRFDSVAMFWLVLTVIVFVDRVKPVEKVSAFSFAFHVAADATYASATGVAVHVPEVTVPRPVRLEVTTFEARVVPVKVPAAEDDLRPQTDGLGDSRRHLRLPG